jgi:hypothetical protein
MTSPPHHPVVTKTEQTITVSLVPASGAAPAQIPLPLVLDLNLFDEIIGIEALHFRAFGGPNILAGLNHPALERVGMRLSYDEAVDTLTLKIHEGPPSKQRSVTGKLLLDSTGKLTGIEANLA